MRLVLLLHIYNSSISLVTFFCGISQLFIICVQSELQTVNRKRVWQTLKVHAQGVAPPMLWLNILWRYRTWMLSECSLWNSGTPANVGPKYTPMIVRGEREQSEATQRVVRSGFALREVEYSSNECQVRCHSEPQCLCMESRLPHTLSVCWSNNDISYCRKYLPLSPLPPAGKTENINVLCQHWVHKNEEILSVR